MKKYIVIGEQSELELKREINEKIKNGWVPIGEASFIDGYFCQSMNKTIDEPVNKS